MAKATAAVEGFVATEPQERSVTGHTLVDVTVAVTPQKKNQSGGYEDSGDTVWYKAAFWDEHGTVVAQSIKKGDLVTLTGTPKLDLYVKEGAAKGSIALDFATIAKVIRKPKRGEVAQQPVEEPWAAPTPTGDVWSTPGSYSDETPF